ncbi:hypothetical protein [Alkalimonas sp.]|uniref:hypothetical protein n=1 Tax=Alkalimonas sp. TaxID=1872453 RepID=UPI00263ACA66|nr:hypothetical protein [Alkalimonas sp.]MCC5826541.1 hypothetical protein [Alkalimonas sp.]
MLKKILWILLLVWLYWHSDLTSTSVFSGVIAPLGFFFGTVTLIVGTVLGFAGKSKTGSAGHGDIGGGLSTSYSSGKSESSSGSGADGGGSGDGGC